MQAAAPASNNTSTDYQTSFAVLASTATSPKSKGKAKAKRKSSLRSTTRAGDIAVQSPEVCPSGKDECQLSVM